MKRAESMEELVNFCKQYGFIFQGSEIYGGLSNTWDYGPLGIELNTFRRAEAACGYCPLSASGGSGAAVG